MLVWPWSIFQNLYLDWRTKVNKPHDNLLQWQSTQCYGTDISCCYGKDIKWSCITTKKSSVVKVNLTKNYRNCWKAINGLLMKESVTTWSFWMFPFRSNNVGIFRKRFIFRMRLGTLAHDSFKAQELKWTRKLGKTDFACFIEYTVKKYRQAYAWNKLFKQSEQVTLIC